MHTKVLETHYLQALQHAGFKPAKPLEVIMFATEEASRFSVPCLGRCGLGLLKFVSYCSEPCALVQGCIPQDQGLQVHLPLITMLSSLWACHGA